ncbi:hypothetical protein [Streptomyces sp. NPDC057854]|uniref:hypothetical protein n=1 Tax=unclassified Streptomyces TaxID=2593676 RepID=UPI0036CA98A4
MKRHARFAVLCASLALVAGLGTALAVQGGSDDEPRISFANSSDSYPAATPIDWVTYADHVVVVTPVEEKDREVPADERERGEGTVLRDLKLQVNDVLWSSPKPAQPAPTEISWIAWGSEFKNGDVDKRIKLAARNNSRVELGHTYVIPIVWEEERCSEGDPRQPARWNALGGSAVIPFDGGTLGQGESEGSVFTVSEAHEKAKSNHAEKTFKGMMVGKKDADLIAELKAASPAERKKLRPDAPCK